MNIKIDECKICNKHIKTAGPYVHCKREGFNVIRKIIKIDNIRYVECDIYERKKNINFGRYPRKMDGIKQNYK